VERTGVTTVLVLLIVVDTVEMLEQQRLACLETTVEALTVLETMAVAVEWAVQVEHEPLELE
jgi:hypothetical protein